MGAEAAQYPNGGDAPTVPCHHVAAAHVVRGLTKPEGSCDPGNSNHKALTALYGMKSPIRRIVKGILVLIATALVFLILVISFGTTETRFACPGEVARTVDTGNQVKTAATLYARIEAYRWIVFWADHDAMIFWEIQPGGDTGFGYYLDSSFGTNITDLAGTRQYGSWSSLSRRIYVETSADGEETFAGICK